MQPVVVIWGDFEQWIHEEHGVVYVQGSELVHWLTSLQPEVREAWRRELAIRVEALAGRAREDDRLPRQST